MKKIKIIPPHLIAHIAAGEVIERPASVVKELVENAIDSNATRITIRLEEGGKKRIIVMDNGDGIPEEELLTATLPHATSKIDQLEDLFSLNTLGFRGEALSSMSTVSRLTIESSTGAVVGTGHKIVVSEGKKLSPVTLIGRPIGTTVMVDSLFYNILPRRKQLKSDRMETSYVIDLVSRFALVYPEIAFILEQNGKEYIRTTGDGNLLKIIADVFGKAGIKTFRQIDFTYEGVVFNGYITTVNGAKKTRKNQVVSINRRIVQNPALHKAIEESVRSFIPPGIFPQYIFNITLPSNRLDCNAHPTKSEVRLNGEEDVITAIQLAVQETLHEDRIVETPVEDEFMTEELGQLSETNVMQIIGQLKNTYILVDINNKLMIIDQHAAHEAIIYHYLKETVLNKRHEMEKVEMDSPVVVELSPQQEVLFAKYQEQLSEMGFETESFGYKSLIVRQIPKGVDETEVRELVDEILAQDSHSRSDWLKRTLINTSCKSAIKANQPLDTYTMEYIVREMLLNQITNCPHGRPLYIATGITELHKQFKRIL